MKITTRHGDGDWDRDDDCNNDNDADDDGDGQADDPSLHYRIGDGEALTVGKMGDGL